MGPKERKVREKEQRRDEIVKAGEKLFLKKGLNGTTMDEIARECELSKGTLYLYFTSKEHLYFEIIDRAMDNMYQAMAKTVEGAKTPLEKLSCVGKGYTLFFKDNVEYFRILSRFMDIDHALNEDLQQIGTSIQEKNARVWKLITDIISEGMQDGTFKSDTDPLEIAVSLYASSTMIMQLMDHMNRNKAEHENIVQCMKGNADIKKTFFDIDFEKILNNLGWRIVESIMTNPQQKKPD